MSRHLSCDACGRKSHLSAVKDWYRDELNNVFCTNACFAENGSREVCVPVFDLFEKLKSNEKVASLYKDKNLELSVVKLEVGQMFGADRNEALPTIHPAEATETIFVLEGELTVTIFRGDTPYPVQLGMNADKHLMIIPRNVSHHIVNTGLVVVKALIFNTPPSHVIEQ